MKILWNVHSFHGFNSFKAICLIGDEEIATEYALSKKEAKKQVAITAIRIALPQPQVQISNVAIIISWLTNIPTSVQRVHIFNCILLHVCPSGEIDGREFAEI